MDDYSDSVMVALLPTTSDWCRIKLPHMTLVYVGKIAELSPTVHNDLAKDALDLGLMCTVFSLKVVGVDVFGGGEDDLVEVLKFEMSPQLQAMRSYLEKWDVSEWPFNPHATIGPVGLPAQDIPMYLTFDRMLVAWGDTKITYHLRR